METRERKVFNHRLTIFSVVVILVFVVLAFNLWKLQIAKAAYYSQKAESNVVKTVITSAVRGSVTDSNGVILAKSVPKSTLVLDWTDLQQVNKDWKSVVEKLAGYIKPYWKYSNQSVDLIAEDILVMIRNQQWESYKPVVVMEDVPLELQAIIAEHANELPGVSIQAVAVRVYPQNYLAGQLLGYVREISSEEIEQFNKQGEEIGDTYQYTQGDLVGKMGVEKTYDYWLRGTHGIDRVGVDSKARPVVKETIQEAQPGNTIQLTIDSSLQKVVEDELERIIEGIQQQHPDAQAGAVVVTEVNTGKVLAMASRPYMNPNDLTGTISDETAEKYFRSQDAASFNRAITGLYPPGSTFKMLTGMAALQKGVVTPNETVLDLMSSLGGADAQLQGIEEWGGNRFGYVDIYSALAHSSNIYFQVMGRRVFENDPEYLRNVAHEFGLGVKSGIDLPGEAIGIAPSAAWKKEYSKPYYDRKYEKQLQDIQSKYAKLEAGASAEDIQKYEKSKQKEINQVEWEYDQNTTYHVEWRLFDSFNSSIGQGYNSYTLIQMANYTATIVNGGKHYQPYVVDKIINPLTGEIVKQNQPTLLNQVSISQENLEIIKKAMSEVTSGEGTASWLFADVPEFTGGGKTGTAQIGSKYSVLGESYNGMFVAFAPYDNPQIAFAGVVEYGGHGGDTAGYVAKAAFKKYFGWK